MIVVEGPDGAGKTTLINTLASELKLPIAPRVVSKDAEAMTDLMQWVDENLHAGWQPTIFDRHRLISEPIYGPILREDFEPGFSDPQWFEPRLRAFYGLNPVIIYCLPDFEVVWENVLSGDDNKVFHGNPRGVRAIWGAYFNKAMTDYVLNRQTWVYDYTWDQSEKMVSLMVKSIAKRIKENS